MDITGKIKYYGNSLTQKDPDNNDLNYYLTLSNTIYYNYSTQNNINTYNNSYLNSLSSYIIYKLPNIFKINNVYSYSYGISPTVDILTISGLILMNFGIPTGQTGATGATGSTGATGPQGDKGNKGNDGDSTFATLQATAVGFSAASAYSAISLSLIELQAQITSLNATVIALSNSLNTLQAKVGWIVDDVNEEKKKTKYLDANRGDGTDVSAINSQLVVKSHVLMGNNKKADTQVIIDGTLQTNSSVLIKGNLYVYGSINYSNAASTTVQPLIQW
jgi:hypothetical protein